MLAITSSNAYEICIIKDNNICIDSYDCINSNYEYILDLEGNKCGNSCDDGKILLVKEKICIDSCNEEYYIIVNNQCGLCKDFYPDKPYKLINTSQCFSESEIPIGTVIYNYNLNLLKCKQNYILNRFFDESIVFYCSPPSPLNYIFNPFTYSSCDLRIIHSIQMYTIRVTYKEIDYLTQGIRHSGIQ